jgi:hypothetical protein
MDDEVYQCPHHPDETVYGEVEDPYVMELYGRSVMMPNCRKCYRDACEDI